MKLLYKPIGLVVGLVAGRVAGAMFKRIWRAVADRRYAPEAKEREATWSEVITAAAMRGAVFAAVRALFDRAAATGFAEFTGVWPGKNRAKGT